MAATLAERLRDSRVNLGWTKADLRRAAKLKAASTITELENGSIQHSPQLPAIAKALGVDALWLQTGRGLPNRLQIAPELDDEETALVAFFRSSSPELRAAILRMIKQNEI